MKWDRQKIHLQALIVGDIGTVAEDVTPGSPCLPDPAMMFMAFSSRSIRKDPGSDVLGKERPLWMRHPTAGPPQNVTT